MLIADFDNEHDILVAVERARAAQARIVDAYTPFPVHGLDKAMGLAASPLTRVCLGFACLGFCGALAFFFWATLVNWPLNIGGKTFDATPALIPLAFEVTILFAGLGTVGTFLVMRGLKPGARPAIAGMGATDDRFLLVLESGSVDDSKLKELLKDCGARRVTQERGK
ncbi:MAG: DUF3341 domain-containing protein [Elusimicrobiota bacterium]